MLPNFKIIGDFDMGNFTFGNMSIYRPMTLKNCGAVRCLTLISGYTYFIEDTLSILDSIHQVWQYLTPSCVEFTLIMGASPGEKGYLDIKNKDQDLEYVFIRNMEKLGPFALRLENYIMKSSLGFTPIGSPIGGRKYKWVGQNINPLQPNSWHQGPNWNVYNYTLNQWEGVTCFPNPADTVIFDSSSFDTTGKSVHIWPRTIAFCKDMIWTNVTNQPTFKISGNLIVEGDFIMDEGMSFGVIEVNDPIADYIFNPPCIYFTSEQEAIINSKRKKMYVDVQFMGEGGAAEFNIKSKLDVKTLRLSQGTIKANHKMIVADRLIIDASDGQKGLLADSSFIVIDSGTIVNNDKYELASFDVRTNNANISCDGTKIVLKGPNSVFNGGRKEYHLVDFRKNGHLVSSSSFDKIIIKNENNFSIGIGDSIVINETFMVADTADTINGIDTTRLFVNEYRRIGESLSPDYDHAKMKLNMSNDLCLQNVKIHDIEVIPDAGFYAYCNFSHLSFSGSNPYLTPPAGWTDRSFPCYSFIEGFVINDSSGHSVDQGLVSCFRVYKDTGQIQYMYDTVGVTRLDSNGRFLFTNLDTGNYILKVDPFNMSLVPHYWPNKKLWHNAGKLHLDTNSMHNVEVHVSPLAPPPTGSFANKIIMGCLNPSTQGCTPQPLFNISGGHLRGPVDIEDSLVIGLFNLSSNNFGVVQTVFSDTTGKFKFVNVDTGSYRIHPDIAGIPVDTGHGLATISIYETTDSMNIAFEVADSMIYPVNAVVTSTDMYPEEELLLWPNPVADRLNIRANYAIETIEVYDLMFRRIELPFTYSGFDAQVDMLNLSSGIYVIYLNGDRVKRHILKP